MLPYPAFKSIVFSLLLTLLSLLAGCGVPSPATQALSLAAPLGFEAHTIQTPFFALFSLQRTGQGEIAHVYIEGDGRAWLTTTRPSLDPTPRYPVALWLTLHDPSPSPLIYLARPGQYTTADGLEAYWTEKRYAEEVLAGYMTALDALKKRLSVTKFVLAGFSGGGSLATLLAARREDVVFLATAAANLDIETWCTEKNLTPLTGSLNPRDEATRLSSLAQRHLLGEEDTTVSRTATENFCQAVGENADCRYLAHMGHTGHWYRVWDYTYQKEKQPKTIQTRD